jgi:hypothetical protein
LSGQLARGRRAVLAADLVPPVLNGHLYRDFHGSGPVVGIKDPAKGSRQQRKQPFGQRYGGFMGKAGKNDVLQLQGLPVYFLRDIRMRMSMDIDPPAADRVDISLSSIIE